MIYTPVKFRNKKFSISILVFIVESVLLLIGLIWMFIRRIPVIDNIKVTPGALLTGVGLGIALLGGSAIFYTIDKLFFKLRMKKMVENHVYPIFKNVTLPQILFIAVMSGFCEEFFFRGVMYPEMGILLSSVIFGLLHTSKKEAWFMGVWTAMIGAVFCITYRITGNLFIPMVAHALNNFAAIAFVRYFYFKMVKTEDGKEEEIEEGSIPGEPGYESMEDATDVDRLKKEALDIFKYKVTEEVEEAKQDFEEIMEEAKEFVQEIKDEFMPEEEPEKIEEPTKKAGEKPELAETAEPEDKTTSYVRILDPKMAEIAEQIKKEQETIEPEFKELEDVIERARKVIDDKEKDGKKTEAEDKAKDSMEKIEKDLKKKKDITIIPEPDYEPIGEIDGEESVDSIVQRFRDFSTDLGSFLQDRFVGKKEGQTVPGELGEKKPESKEGQPEKGKPATKKPETGPKSETPDQTEGSGKDVDKKKKPAQDKKGGKTDKPRKGTTIDPDRRADDIDDEGIGTVHKPQ